MAVPNLAEVATTTIDNRSMEVADNVTKNNALLTWIKSRGNIKPLDGGDNINMPISFQENANASWYSGLDPLPTQAVEVLSSAQVQWKQLAAAVVLSGLDKLKNRGESKILDLLDERMEVAENTLANFVDQGMFSDGTTYAGKTITGLDLVVPTANTTGTYAGINRATWSFWQSQLQSDSGAPTNGSSGTALSRMTTLVAKCTRGADTPDLILLSNTYWGIYVGALQQQVRFTNEDKAKMGFRTSQFLNADVVLAGGIGGSISDTNGTGFFLNTKYFKLRPHVDRQFTALDPEKRYSTNQDATIALIGWAGNLVCTSPRLQGRWINT